jgi:hypothetical protein
MTWCSVISRQTEMSFRRCVIRHSKLTQSFFYLKISTGKILGGLDKTTVQHRNYAPSGQIHYLDRIRGKKKSGALAASLLPDAGIIAHFRLWNLKNFHTCNTSLNRILTYRDQKAASFIQKKNQLTSHVQHRLGRKLTYRDQKVASYMLRSINNVHTCNIGLAVYWLIVIKKLRSPCKSDINNVHTCNKDFAVYWLIVIKSLLPSG